MIASPLIAAQKMSPEPGGVLRQPVRSSLCLSRRHLGEGRVHQEFYGTTFGHAAAPSSDILQKQPRASSLHCNET